MLLICIRAEANMQGVGGYWLHMCVAAWIT